MSIFINAHWAQEWRRESGEIERVSVPVTRSGVAQLSLEQNVVCRVLKVAPRSAALMMS